jgi:hypothetical protein
MTSQAWVASFTRIEVAEPKFMSCELAESDIQALSTILRELKQGEPLGPNAFPKQMWNQKPKPIRQLPQVFMGAGYWVLGSKAAAVFRQFDLGGGGLYPVEILQEDRSTPVAGDYFCLCFGNKKSSLLSEQSQGLRPIGAGSQYWKLPAVPADDSIILSGAALSGPDIWIDPALWHTFFVSDGLAQALKAAKVDGPFSLTRCKVV